MYCQNFRDVIHWRPLICTNSFPLKVSWFQMIELLPWWEWLRQSLSCQVYPEISKVNFDKCFDKKECQNVKLNLLFLFFNDISKRSWRLGVPIWLPVFFLFFYNEPELGARIDPGMALTPSIFDETRLEHTTFWSRVEFANPYTGQSPKMVKIKILQSHPKPTPLI